MRLVLFVAFAVIFSGTLRAQNSLMENNFNTSSTSFFKDSLKNNNLPADKKWFVSKFIGLSSGIGFFKGGNASFFAAPIGLQLNRRLSNNWYAFAGLSITPVYVNFNNSFLNTSSNKFIRSNNGLEANNFSVNPQATMGLMYTNDQKTFSISGSISIDKTNYSYAPLNQFGNLRSANFNANPAFGR